MGVESTRTTETAACRQHRQNHKLGDLWDSNSQIRNSHRRTREREMPQMG